MGMFDFEQRAKVARIPLSQWSKGVVQRAHYDFLTPMGMTTQV